MATVTRSGEEPTTVSPAWHFRRRDDRCTIQRSEEAADWFLLLVTTNGTTKTYRFSDLDRLIAFQTNMEDFLVRTGWSLESFTPERRNGRDRRRMPRIENDRRRWWTDPPRD